MLIITSVHCIKVKDIVDILIYNKILNFEINYKTFVFKFLLFFNQLNNHQIHSNISFICIYLFRICSFYTFVKLVLYFFYCSNKYYKNIFILSQIYITIFIILS